MENSIDAGASAVTVEIRGGGIDFIRVTDNGSGIPSSEIRQAFMPHATSKIRSADDLFDIKEKVLQTFVFPDIDEKNKDIAKQIENSQSISVHVRRGDYVEQGVDTLKGSFYDRAIEIIKQKTTLKDEDIKIYVFSDDKEYVQKLFKDRSNVIFVDGNTGKDSYRDMQLMSMCRYNVIADSTFSFWGAFLNRNVQKIVIGPDRPFKGFKNPFSCDDWIKLKV